jgi:hypothetical protein
VRIMLGGTVVGACDAELIEDEFAAQSDEGEWDNSGLNEAGFENCFHLDMHSIHSFSNYVVFSRLVRVFP